MGKYYIIDQDNKKVYIAHKGFSEKMKKATFFDARKIAEETIISRNLSGCKVKRLSMLYMFLMDFFKKAANHER